jgi:threonylcarbamoyladenosine tRNA methylthiotransferase MtaB
MSVDVLNFGCRLNAGESDVMRREALKAGLSDTVIVNTCAVTAEAVRQCRQAVRRVKRERPHARIVVTGCAAQIEPTSFAQMPEVALVLGNDQKLDVSRWSQSWDDKTWNDKTWNDKTWNDKTWNDKTWNDKTWNDKAWNDKAWNDQTRDDGSGHQQHSAALALPVEEKIKVNDIMSVRETAVHLAGDFAGRVRAFVQVQNGCDHRCTFCIIPYGRGNSRSVPMGEVVAHVRGLCQRGCREVILTGVDLTSYGSNLPGAPKLGTLVRQILKHVPELPRLRLSSIDSVEADDALIDAFANESRLMPHLHLSLQAGDDLTLKRMKRRHSRADAIAFCALVRRLRPDVALGADLIAGFPTESEDMFARSLELVDACGLTHLHVFPFSARLGTPAARMPQLPAELIKERARRLREQGEAARKRYLDRQIGSTHRVLAISPQRGHTEQFTEVHLQQAATPGSIVDRAITGHDGKQLLAA